MLVVMFVLVVTENSETITPYIARVESYNSIYSVQVQFDARLLPFVSAISIFHYPDMELLNLQVMSFTASDYPNASLSVDIVGSLGAMNQSFYLNSTVGGTVYTSQTVQVMSQQVRPCGWVK